MNQNKHTTEELLEKGKGITLSTDERDDIKAQLLTYAQYHGQKEQHSPRRFHATWWFRSASAFAVVLFALTGTGYASMDSLPNEPLYAVKVHVVEEMIQAMTFDQDARFAYSVDRIEARYGELRALAAQEALTPELLQAIDTQIGEHLHDMNAVFTADHDDSLAKPSVLREMTTAVAVVRAARQFVALEKTDISAEHFDHAIDTAVSMHHVALEGFVERHAVSEVETFISENLILIGTELAGSDISTSTTLRVTEYLEDASAALDAGELGEASVHAGEAVQRVLVEEYLNWEDGTVTE